MEIIIDTNYQDNAVAILFISILTFFLGLYIVRHKKEEVIDNLITFFVGAIFSMGLGFGGMLKRKKIENFLAIHEDWDPQLLILFISAVAFNIISFHFIIKVRGKPVLASTFNLPPVQSPVDIKLVLGAGLFGVGWGIGGLCPGPALNLFTQFTLQIGVVWFVGFTAG